METKLPTQKRVFLALDKPDLDKARAVLEPIAPHLYGVKVGLEMITAVGPPELAKFLRSLGVENMFLDIKYHDIQKTMGAATRAAAALGFSIINLHASAEVEGMMAAVANKGKADIYAVSVLTTLDEEEAFLTFGEPTKAKVLQFARNAKLAGVDGIICSPLELPLFAKHKELTGLKKITPGIRPEWAKPAGQKRFTTPTEAIKGGASYLVIGDPILNPPPQIGSSLKAIEVINYEVTVALAEAA